ncbi:EAL domain-containing protein [Rheinheimera sp. UJ51]|uniref:putative bifunctional diguanylate cyclase/phosphodiesterase n=1 Tax=unclassified Rheinheimera TaxID=115860 RepID=UPI001E51EE1E|nr:MULTISPECIES: EAL domain-containing protein [unclassified Rheinheimera]MCC5451162.1 EAL domain-containing protein [Rheinheimera sp. UJ51]MCF4010089.1 EAL domain-containing protein [Rheinheimera sp. UJ63]
MSYKKFTLGSLILLAFFSPYLAATVIDWTIIEPYLLYTVMAIAVAGFLLAQFNQRRMRTYHQALAKSEERLRLSIWGSGDELWDWNIESGELYRSSAWLEPLSAPPEGKNFPPNKNLIHPQDLERVSSALSQHLAGNSPFFESSYRLRTADDNYIWVLDRGKVVAYNSEGKAQRMTGTLKNISQLKQAEARMQLFARCLENISDAVVICDTKFNIIEVNPAFSSITGNTRESVLQTRFKLSLYPPRFLQEIEKTLVQKGRWSDEIRELKTNGDYYQAELTFDVIKDEQGFITQYVAVFSDISERKRRDAELNRLANSDTLTGLPNRAVFMNKLASLVKDNTQHALLVFDLDNFKKINDSLGHELGDALLCKLSERLHNNKLFRQKLYRLGGDEFAILLSNTNDIHAITSVAKAMLQQINTPFAIEQHELVVTSSIGIVLFPEDGKDPQALLRNADTAMYHAKSAGANRYLFFNDTMNKQAVKRLQVENLIRHGLKEDLFTVFYQPKMDLLSGKVVGMEALVRFITPKGGLVSPASFIPVAEETGQIVDIGTVVLRKACLDVRRWIDQGLFHGRVAVNLSAKQFMLPFLCDQIDDILQQTQLASYHLELEITEGTVMESPKLAIDTMKKLRARGIHLAMDDFGTGYSSLAYLKQFPLNTLKIDKAFIDDMNSARGRNMVDTIVTIAHNLSLSVVAEGVETIEQLEQLRKLRCEIIQGYYYSKPLSADDFAAFLQEQKKPRLSLTANGNNW